MKQPPRPTYGDNDPYCLWCNELAGCPPNTAPIGWRATSNPPVRTAPILRVFLVTKDLEWAHVSRKFAHYQPAAVLNAEMAWPSTLATSTGPDMSSHITMIKIRKPIAWWCIG
jgi:hypothetical protein